VNPGLASLVHTLYCPILPWFTSYFHTSLWTARFSSWPFKNNLEKFLGNCWIENHCLEGSGKLKRKLDGGFWASNRERLKWNKR